MTWTDADPAGSVREAEVDPWGGVDLSGLPTSVAGALRTLMTATDALAEVEGSDLDGGQAAVMASVLAVAGSRLGVVGVGLLPVIEADGAWAATGARSFAVWVAAAHRVGIGTARAQVRLGRALRDHLPATAAAATAGRISADHAAVLGTYAPTSAQRRQVLADRGHECNEEFLVTQASRLHVDALRGLVRHWAAAADPDADDRGYVDSADREHLDVSRLAEGYHVAGWLTVEHGQVLTQALAAVTTAPAADDDRTGTQRRAQALADLARVALDHGLVGTGRAVRPRISVLVSHADLTALAHAARHRGVQGTLLDDGAEGPTRPAPVVTAAMLTGGAVAGGPQFEDGTPVPRALLDRLACDSELNRIIFGPRSQVLDVGRAERTFTGSRRAAIVARDKHCRYPTCTAPPALCEGHHVQHWARDLGPTAVDNGILLCWHHHALVHRRRLRIHRDAHRWTFLDPDGCPVDPDHDRAPAA